MRNDPFLQPWGPHSHLGAHKSPDHRYLTKGAMRALESLNHLEN